jgi:hypothetical protein
MRDSGVGSMTGSMTGSYAAALCFPNVVFRFPITP